MSDRPFAVTRREILAAEAVATAFGLGGIARRAAALEATIIPFRVDVPASQLSG